MGCNYYLKKAKPIEVYPEYHIAKVSWGWEPLFQAHPSENNMPSIDDSEPTISSVDDIKRLVRSGEWIVVDEYGEEISWEEFDEKVVRWADDDKHRRKHGVSTYRDINGITFTSVDFR